MRDVVKHCTSCGHEKTKREVERLESYDEDTGNKIKVFRWFCTNSECRDYMDEACLRAVTKKSTKRASSNLGFGGW